ncbi:Putative component of the secretory vesicle docking complex [Yamadazyma tenuis]|uniref:Uncharacterized protein n=1 Tax=Candida tenuis (strain ATCC 10573 / BCRC 21748 / CBS 615 / JCM 9827 / NBRC 10315 / NRRL Y-1498 / VKM Y-70) TaxID=590646 RepID=G3BEK6_CANTC|nr:uncharacterized protein CANTEDRAFT_116647 [Yamadazyma tenuis ATCC 10573]EGV60567.1 hypothetical protein CANTEDRAFT_116647 [Yamadazyma tenuis ATCC 10573]WEJ94189.1 Putative component of the secretory vesicle docking complex [Yamadazyma tenuis]
MNQYQNRSAEEQKTFLSKIKDNYSAKFGNLSLTSSIQKASSYVDKDGNSETDTLIHKAFVKYFDSQNQAYPEWLGVPAAPARSSARAGPPSGYTNVSSSQYKPVYSNYNTPQPPSQQQPQAQSQYAEPAPAAQSAYKPRSSSRLQDMYNKSRQQHVPGGGYNTVNQAPARTNSSTSGARLRERMMNSTSMTGMNNVISEGNNGGSGGSNGSKATWGRR